jgi:AcrR family transcriptional regulator
MALGQAFKPRKQPVQARSEATVAALFEASIQVLVDVGYRKLTTTRVAERAGVSVGTLYQYFPNRQALINSVIERYLDEISSSIERDCQSLNGCSLDEIATGLVDAFIAAKWRRLDVAKAMHEPLVDVGGAELVSIATTQGAELVAGLLASCSDARFRDVISLAQFIVTACSSLLQAAVINHTGSVQRSVLQDHMRAMVLGYLREMRCRS